MLFNLHSSFYLLLSYCGYNKYVSWLLMAWDPRSLSHLSHILCILIFRCLAAFSNGHPRVGCVFVLTFLFHSRAMSSPTFAGVAEYALPPYVDATVICHGYMPRLSYLNDAVTTVICHGRMRMLCGYYVDVSWILRGCYMDVTWMLRGCYSDVMRMLHGCG